MIYLDNAATTWPKPACVEEAVIGAIRACGNPGRGAHPLSNRASEVLFDCRERAGQMFGTSPEGVIFTYSATHGLNYIIKGLLHPGDEVLISGLSHNAVRRPAAALRRAGIGVKVYPYTPEPEILLNNIMKSVTPKTAMLVSTHCSNICGAVEPVELIGEFCRKRGIRFVVDGAQSGGHLPIDMKKMSIDALCLPGHKGLCGIPGAGMLLLGEGISGEAMTTIIEGGSGIRSMEEEMPPDLPERLEPGTPGIPAIAGLCAGLGFVEATDLRQISRHMKRLSSTLIEQLRRDGHPVYGDFGNRGHGGVVSFNVKGRSPAEVGAYLAERDICVRTGLHCAPLAHQTIAAPAQGTVRVSFSPWNRLDEITELTAVLRGMK